MNMLVAILKMRKMRFIVANWFLHRMADRLIQCPYYQTPNLSLPFSFMPPILISFLSQYYFLLHMPSWDPTAHASSIFKTLYLFSEQVNNRSDYVNETGHRKSSVRRHKWCSLNPPKRSQDTHALPITTLYIGLWVIFPRKLWGKKPTAFVL